MAPEEVTSMIEALAAGSERPAETIRALGERSQMMSLAGDILRDKALGVIVSSATAVDSDGQPVSLDLTTEDEVPAAFEVEGEVVEAGVVGIEPEVVEAEVVEAEIVSIEES